MSDQQSPVPAVNQQPAVPAEDTIRPHLWLGFHGRVIDHLGIQMYQSPVAAVAEIVSNAWDAEAERVNIDLPQNLSPSAEIVVTDDGFGMTFQQCQDRFLEVGFDKRGDDPRKKSPNKHRTVLGRKGIGKFAGFGIAEVIQVATISHETGEKTVFKLDVTKLRGNEYVGRDSKEIEVVSYEGPNGQRRSEHGTVISLQRLNVAQRPSPLVFGKSMARRFLLHQRFGDFVVLVNGLPLPEAEDQQNIQFVFPRDYSAAELPDGISIHSDGSGTETLPNGRSIRWRFAFYQSPIDEEELRGVAVFANSKLAQTPFLFNLVGGTHGQQGVEYLSGSVEADYLDELPIDIIAPERQRIDWDHPESFPVIVWGQARVKHLLRIWTTHRAQQRLAILTAKIEPFSPRLQKLPRHDRDIRDCIERLCGCQSSYHQGTHSDLDERLAGLRQLLVVLREAPLLAKPRERALHHPAARQHREAFLVGGLNHDLQVEAPAVLDPLHQRPVVVAVRPDLLKPRQAQPEAVQQTFGGFAVADVGGGDQAAEQQALGVYQDVALAAVDLLAAVIAPDPPFSVVLMDWLSKTAAEGCGSRPRLWRTCSRRRSWMFCQVPSCFQCQK